MSTRMNAVKKAIKTDKWTQTLFLALAARVAKRWRFVSFRGVGGGEWKGVVDVLAIRKDTSKSSHEILKTGDLFDIVLIQMKGGSAPRPTELDLKRLQAVRRRYRAKEIVLFSWKQGQGTHWETWVGGKWQKSTSRAIFGA